MQTILGASGQIGQELAAALYRDFTRDIRIVSRNPRPVNDSDEVMAANLLDEAETSRAVQGSQIVYLTAGLPMDTKLWTEQWPVIMRNVISACEKHKARLVFFDNTYMYPQTAAPQTENTAFHPEGEKGRVRAAIAGDLLAAISSRRLSGMICRAPEFYGPGRTQSMTNTSIIKPLAKGRPARVFLRDDTLRSLIFTPDASRAMALLGNTPDAYDQTWQLALAGWFSPRIRGAGELLPRYAVDNIFVSAKFKKRFPEFRVTTFREGLAAIRASLAAAVDQ